MPDLHVLPGYLMMMQQRAKDAAIRTPLVARTHFLDCNRFAHCLINRGFIARTGISGGIGIVEENRLECLSGKICHP